jgi:hypothetical protein
MHSFIMSFPLCMGNLGWGYSFKLRKLYKGRIVVSDIVVKEEKYTICRPSVDERYKMVQTRESGFETEVLATST